MLRVQPRVPVLCYEECPAHSNAIGYKVHPNAVGQDFALGNDILQLCLLNSVNLWRCALKCVHVHAMARALALAGKNPTRFRTGRNLQYVGSSPVQASLQHLEYLK